MVFLINLMRLVLFIFCYLLMIILGSIGFIYLKQIMKHFLPFYYSRPWLKHNFLPKLKLSKVIGEMNIGLFQLIYIIVVLNIMILVLTLHNKIVMLKGKSPCC